jgi:D-amino-acid dehydrogenase
MSNPDVVVIGAGAIGAAAAHALAARGAHVVVIERSLNGDGCSYGNAGLVCPSHSVSLASPAALRSGLRWMTSRSSPFYVRPSASLLPWLARFALASRPTQSNKTTQILQRLAVESLRLYGELGNAGLETGLIHGGILSVFESRRLFETARRTSAGEVLEPHEARMLEPALSEDIAGAILSPDDAWCDPTTLTEGLLAGARRHGADIRRGVEVRRLRRARSGVDRIETSHGDLTAGTVVLAAGAWTSRLARQVGVRIPLQPAKGYHVEVDAPARRLRLPIYMEDAYVIGTPLDGRLRLAGTLELTGGRAGIDPVRIEALHRAGSRVLGLPAGAPHLHVWQGFRPCTADGLPVIGWSGSVANMLIATGHAMLGITLAPLTGKLVSDLVAGEASANDVEPLSPTRFETLWRRR